ncbi:glycoside hydrolase family 25 protein [Acanthopleuribacter pedis]|uniref:Lysozyme n=1 Tax=Acanthopleuribacter pedis TaxID=442870 RepID=A0A8J7U4V0_9BACT|nr:GH25 family lysozyme [Acanthopleuribacter pedis]MBO1321032.1 hypothetical protein [Acanthopleuribacter pedis]
MSSRQLLFVPLGLLCLFGVHCNQGSQSPTPTQSETPTQTAGATACRGIDVSHYSGAVDWTKVKSDGYAFAFTKATEGVDWIDPELGTNLPGIKAAGLVRGAYHFYVVGDDPHQQAQNFIKNTPLVKGDLVPVVDIETANQNISEPLLAEDLRTFLDVLETHFGGVPAIYTGPSFWNQHLSDEDFTRYPLWLAQYEVSKPQPPGKWTSYWLWQSAENQTVAGVTNNADLNQCGEDSQAFFSKTLQ